MKQTKILVVGLGSIGQRHARLLAARQDVALSLCDPVPANLQQACSMTQASPVMTFDDYALALAEQPAGVMICTPNSMHVPMALQAMDTGAHVFVEKPISDDLSQARQLVTAAAQAGRLLQVGYMLRFDPGLMSMKEVIDAGGIGQLVGGRAMIGTYITLLNAKSPDRDKRRNSLIVDYTHELDFIRWFFGETEQLQAMGAVMGNLDMRPQPNIFQMNMKMRSGALVQVHMDYIQHPQRRIFEVHGDRGMLEYDFMTGHIKHFQHGPSHQWSSLDVPPIAQRVDDLYRAEHDAFIKSLTCQTPVAVSGHEGLAALELAQRAIDACKQG